RRRVEKQVRHPENAVEGGAKLVADGGQKARLRLARRFGTRALLLERALKGDALGDVAPGAHDLGSAVATRDGGLDPGEPAHAGRRLNRLIDDPRRAVADPCRTTLDDDRARPGPDQVRSGLAD